jgi:hypothetical protein
MVSQVGNDIMDKVSFHACRLYARSLKSETSH